MIRKGVFLVAAILGMGLGATGVAAQPVGCDFCGNHFWYNEHIHGNELHSLYDNKQGHGGEWYPYNCGVDHRLCEDGGVHMALAEAEAELTEATESPDWSPVQVARLLESLAARGVTAKESSGGIEIAASCQQQGPETTQTRTVALSDPMQQRLREAMSPRIHGP